MKKELTIQEIAKRSEISKRLLKKSPTEWTSEEIMEWLKAGFKLPKILYEKKIDNNKNKSYKKKII